MEKMHMNHIRDLIHRLRAGDSERRIAQDMRLSRQTVVNSDMKWGLPKFV